MDERGEIEMRVAGAADPAQAAGIEAALRALDPDIAVRIDPVTGIVHATTRCETLDVVAALAQAGYEAGAMTG